jgi:hypothetical protein
MNKKTTISMKNTFIFHIFINCISYEYLFLLLNDQIKNRLQKVKLLNLIMSMTQVAS